MIDRWMPRWNEPRVSNQSASSPVHESLQLLNMRHCRYLESVRRFNYTTPKSYLELISLYKGLLEKKRAELRANKERLENGVDKISQASAQVGNDFCLLLQPAALPYSKYNFDLKPLAARFVNAGDALQSPVNLPALPMLERPITD